MFHWIISPNFDQCAGSSLQHLRFKMWSTFDIVCSNFAVSPMQICKVMYVKSFYNFNLMANYYDMSTLRELQESRKCLYIKLYYELFISCLDDFKVHTE